MSPKHLIGGQLVDGGSRRAPIYNPSTGAVIREVPLADAATLQQAVDAAQAAFPACAIPRRPSAPRCCSASSSCWRATKSVWCS